MVADVRMEFSEELVDKAGNSEREMDQALPQRTFKPCKAKDTNHVEI